MLLLALCSNTAIGHASTQTDISRSKATQVHSFSLSLYLDYWYTNSLFIYISSQANIATGVVIDLFEQHAKTLLGSARYHFKHPTEILSFNMFSCVPSRDNKLVLSDSVRALEARLIDMLRLFVLIARSTTSTTSNDPLKRLREPDMCILLTDVSLSLSFWSS